MTENEMYNFCFGLGVVLGLLVMGMLWGFVHKHAKVETGHEWGECFPNDSCHVGYVCYHEKCVAKSPKLCE